MGVILQVGRREVSKVVTGKSLSRPLCLDEHVAQFGINHKRTMVPAGQSRSVDQDELSGKDTTISARMIVVRHEFIHSFSQFF